MSRQFLTSINLNKNELLNARIQNLATPPQSPVKGQVYFNTGDNSLRYWDGAAWQTLSQGNSVDSAIAAAIAAYDALTSGVHGVTGDVVGTSDSQTLTNKTLGSGTVLSANLDADNSFTVVNLVDPQNPQDAATKAYVDATAQGLNVKESVLVATTENILDLANVGSPVTIDTVLLVTNSRVLVKDQETASENGIYVYDGIGALTRAADQLVPDKGDYVFVEAGSQAARGFIVTDIVGVVVWTQFSAAGEYTGGDGIDIANAQISVKHAGGLDVDGSNNLYVKTGDGLYNDPSTGATSVAVGTGLEINGSNQVAFSAGYGVRKFAANNSALTAISGAVTWVVNHNLGTEDVTVQLVEALTSATIEVDVEITDSNNVTLSWVSAGESSDAYRVVIVG